MSLDQLFRNEAAAYQTQRLYGTILLRQPWSATVLTLLFSGLVGLLIVFFFTAGFSRKESLDGLVQPDRGLIRVTAPQAGVVVKKMVAEGQRVRAGDVLFVVSHAQSTRPDEAQDDLIDALTARIASLQEVLIHAEHPAEPKLPDSQRRREEMPAWNVALGAEIERPKKRISMAEEVERRYEIARSIHDAERMLAEREARRQVLVRAAIAGVVSAVSVEPGQSVSQAEFLAALEPAGSILEAVLYAPTRTVGSVRPGMPVELRFDAFPYEKFGQFRGTVKEVSATPVKPSGWPESSRGDADTLRYRVRVAIDGAGLGPAIQLKAGMRAQAALQIERRKLYEWSFRPLLQMTERSL